ncbi:unnamed protein product, partial [Heterotrigona itama]
MYDILSIFLALFKLAVMIFYRTEFTDILLYAQKHFWHLDYNHDEKLLFAECRKICKLCAVFLLLVSESSISFYAISPICANIGHNKSDRILPFKMWVNLSLSETPYYEIMFAIQILAVQVIAIIYICPETILCVLSMHVVYQFRILQNTLLNLWSDIDKGTDIVAYSDKCYEILKKCIRKHQSLIEYNTRFEGIFTLPILSNMVIISVLMCFDSYEIILADVPTGTRLIFFFHMIGTFIYVIFFTYICHGLVEESSNINMASYSGCWTILPMNESGRMLRRDINIMIMKSMRPCQLT